MKFKESIKKTCLFLSNPFFQRVLTKTEYVILLAYFKNDFRSLLGNDFSTSRIGKYIFVHLFRKTYFKCLKKDDENYQILLRKIAATLKGDFSYASITSKELFSKNPSNCQSNIFYQINQSIENNVFDAVDLDLFNKVVENLAKPFAEKNQYSEFKVLPDNMFCNKSVCIIGPSCVTELIPNYDYYIYFGLPDFFSHKDIPVEKLIIFTTDAKFNNINTRLKDRHKGITLIWSGDMSSESKKATKNYNVINSQFSGRLLDGMELIAGVELLLYLYNSKASNIYLTGLDLYLSRYNDVYLSLIHDDLTLFGYFNRSLSFIHNIDMQFILNKMLHHILNIQSDILFNDLMHLKLSDYLDELEKHYKIK